MTSAPKLDAPVTVSDAECADIGMLLTVERLHKSLQQAMEDLLRPQKLSLTQWLILSGMAKGHGHTLTHFSQQLERDAGALSRAIYLLSQRGLVRLERNPLDRRSTRLSLTTEGRRIHEDVAPQITRMMKALEHAKHSTDHGSIWPLLVAFAERVECCRGRASFD